MISRTTMGKKLNHSPLQKILYGVLKVALAKVITIRR